MKFHFSSSKLKKNLFWATLIALILLSCLALTSVWESHLMGQYTYDSQQATTGVGAWFEAGPELRTRVEPELGTGAEPELGTGAVPDPASGPTSFPVPPVTSPPPPPPSPPPPPRFCQPGQICHTCRRLAAKADILPLGQYLENDTLFQASWRQVSRDKSIQLGGFYSPTLCDFSVRTRVAILVPYRDRADNLKRFLAYMHPFLQRQDVEYKIYVISQLYDKVLFNRGTLLNIGYQFSTQDHDWDCLMLHDVDLLPENQDNIYECWDQPRHMSVYIKNLGSKPEIQRDEIKYMLPYEEYFGGISALTPKQFHAINGFSNVFFGWGGEDDDLKFRVSHAKFSVLRSNGTVGRYIMMGHSKQVLNDKRFKQLAAQKRAPSAEGLSTLKYQLVKFKSEQLYTNITVKFAPKKA